MEGTRGTLGPQPFDVGTRIEVRSPRLVLVALAGRIGTVVEVFRVPLDSCMVRLDDDLDRQREWFLYRDEFALSDS
jgi:hypothetical protein